MSNGRQPTSQDIARLLKLKTVEPAELPEAARVHRMAVAETGAGRGQAAPDSEFVRSIKKRVIRQGRTPFAQTHPSWVRALVEKNAADEEMVDATKKRLSRAPTQANLLLAQAIANDLGRKPGGGERVRKVLTQELVDQLIGREG